MKLYATTLAPFQPKSVKWLRLCIVVSVAEWIYSAADQVHAIHTAIVRNTFLVNVTLAVLLAGFLGMLSLLVAAIIHVVRRKLGFARTLLMIVIFSFTAGIAPVLYFWFVWKQQEELRV